MKKRQREDGPFKKQMLVLKVYSLFFALKETTFETYCDKKNATKVIILRSKSVYKIGHNTYIIIIIRVFDRKYF